MKLLKIFLWLDFDFYFLDTAGDYALPISENLSIEPNLLASLTYLDCQCEGMGRPSVWRCSIQIPQDARLSTSSSPPGPLPQEQEKKVAEPPKSQSCHRIFIIYVRFANMTPSLNFAFIVLEAV